MLGGSMTRAPLIYNLFPRLVGNLLKWPEHTARAQQMGFDWVFINPFHAPGFSGSLYAVKDFYRINPLFAPPGSDDPLALLRQVIEEIHGQGLLAMMDLVINHTAKDSPLVKTNPSWFRRDKDGYVVSPSAIDPADARNITVWDDLAEVDNAHSEDRHELWAYWTALVQFYLDLGFDGFRCDAAYKVPARLWRQLVDAAHRCRASTVFVAETLGARMAEVVALKDAGFDYFYNSSKWWHFDKPWCLAQHERLGAIAPSISFPETHDTGRLMEETGGLVQVQKQRYAFAATFSEGLMMPIGYEFGFRQRLNVALTQPAHWEKTSIDLQPMIRRINALKKSTPILRTEGSWSLLDTDLDRPTVRLGKRTDHTSDVYDLVVLVNKDWCKGHESDAPPVSIFARADSKLTKIVRLFDDGANWSTPLPTGGISLGPAEVALVLPADRDCSS
jgi:starch synthase (maltosyl-transferring)